VRFLFDRLCNPWAGASDVGSKDYKALVLLEIAQEVERICSQRSAFMWPRSQAPGVLGFGINRGIGHFDDPTALRVKCAEIQRAVSSGEPRLRRVIVEAKKGQTVGKLSLTVQGVAMVDGEAFDFDRDVVLRVGR
tara:strand:- start:3628 stop:4032 length:405 start_codon:yes stop_codon:yes gene_type:complete